MHAPLNKGTLVVLFFALFLGLTLPRQVTATRIAILEFDAVNDEARQSNKGRIISEKITTEAVKSDKFEVVERHLIQRILDENRFGDSGISGTVAQQIGQMLGADAVMTGSVSQYKGELSIDARLIDVNDGRILMAEEAFARDDLQGIAAAARQVFRNMVGIIGPESEAAPPAPRPRPEQRGTIAPAPSAPQGKWLVIMASIPQASQSEAQRRLAGVQQDVPQAYLVNSDEYANLRNGFLVVVEGPYAKDYAEQRLHGIRRFVPDAYVKAGW